MSTPEALFGEIRALLHEGRPSVDMWSAIMGVLHKLQAPEHALCRTQIAHYLQAQIARDDAWIDVPRQAPIAWTSPHVDRRPNELLSLFDSFHIELEHISREELRDHLDMLAIHEDAITHIELDVLAEDAHKVLDVLARMPNVRALTCHKSRDELSFDLEAMRQSTAPATLRTLVLDDARLGNHGFDHLLAIPWLGQLEHLNVGWSSLHTSDIAALCEVPFDRLETLELEYCNLDAESIATLCVHEGMRHLRTLDVNLNGLHDECGEFLARATFADQIERLDLSFNQLSDAGIMQLCTHHFPSLRQLQLDGNDLHGTSIRLLAGATFTPRLERLGLCFSKEVPDMDWLALGAQLAHITHLELSYCHLTERVLQGLTHHLSHRVLHNLHLSEVHPDNDPQALMTLVEAMPHTGLRELALGSNQLTDAHLLTLERPFPLLTELHLEHNPAGARGLAHLLCLIAPHRLELLTMSHNPSPRDEEGFAALVTQLSRQQIAQLDVNLTGGDEALLLQMIAACAPSLTALSLKGEFECSTGFYEVLGQMYLPHLRHLTCHTREGAPHARFMALTRGALCHNPMMRTLSWNHPGKNQGVSLDLPSDVHPWLSLNA